MSEFGRISPRVRHKMTAELKKQGICNKLVIDALNKVKRHIFVEEALQHKAYDNTALPITNNQTISQPYVVALMTEALLGEQKKLDRVLEIGTGSGYQAAILSQVCKKVYSVERIKALIEKAKEALAASKINNVEILHGDGHLGWHKMQPFDGIIVTAAAKGVPTSLFDQLKVGGRIVIPVQNNDSCQDLLLVTKTKADYEYQVIEKVRFVPMLPGKS